MDMPHTTTLRSTRPQPRNTLTGQQNIGTLTSDDFDAVFETLGEELFVIRRDTGAILWMSNACRGLNHKLGSTRNINEFPGLCKLILGTLPTEAPQKMHSQWHTTDDTWQQLIGDNTRAYVSVLCTAEHADKIWVRFSNYKDNDDYFRKYISDREKLFSTSRSLSVSEMATTLAHELNQPIGSLLNLVNGIHKRLETLGEGSEEIFDALNLARKQGRFAADVLSRIRDFAQSKQPNLDSCDLSALLEDTVMLLDWIFVREKVDVKLNMIDTSVCINADATLLQQVLVNLMKNAVEAMNDNNGHAKTISITAKVTPDGISIDICDNGHGLSDEGEALFKPFVSNKPDGMGVGLNICRSFIELHQGRFWFTQNTLRGCTAHILLPKQYMRETGASIC